jgi:adenine phosphoribosyltransferase
LIGLDARGFLFGPLVALRLGAAFVPVRKQGKLPGECVSAVYEKEYGQVNRKKKKKDDEG